MTASPQFQALHREVMEAIRSESLATAGFGAELG